MNQLDKRDYKILNFGAAVVPGICFVAYLMFAWGQAIAGLFLFGIGAVVELMLMLPRARLSTKPLVTRRKSAEGYAFGVAIFLFVRFLARIPEFEALVTRLLSDNTLSDWKPTTALAISLFLWILRRRASIKKLEVDRITMIYGFAPPLNPKIILPNKPAHPTAGNVLV
jgi:hypothetical protein